MSNKRVLAVILSILVSGSPASGLAVVVKGYYPSGELMQEQNYKNGKQEGITTVYY